MSSVLGAVWLALWVRIDWWQRQPTPVFAAAGVPLLAWYVLAALGVAALLWKGSRPRPNFATAVVLVAGIVPFPLLLMALGSDWPDSTFWPAAVAVAGYSLAYLLRGLRAATGSAQWLVAGAGVLALAALIAASDALEVIPDVWTPQETLAADELAALRETALFEQAARIDEALEHVKRDDSARSQAFFLGFAGVGDQKVFAQEIGLASRVLGERYGIGDRSISLINDERDLEAAPLASVSGLTYALQGLAARMDLDRDVLFLAIASHGSQDPAIAVENSQLPFIDLTPEDLVGALRASGIQWRVIVISACYAGGFVDSLRDSKTIVITAAAADRTSFGCSNDSDLTYFGEAFYRDSLPGAGSLRAAFDQARAAIAAREKREGETPSEPQAFFGAEAEAKLLSLRP